MKQKLIDSYDQLTADKQRILFYKGKFLETRKGGHLFEFDARHHEVLWFEPNDPILEKLLQLLEQGQLKTTQDVDEWLSKAKFISQDLYKIGRQTQLVIKKPLPQKRILYISLYLSTLLTVLLTFYYAHINSFEIYQTNLLWLTEAVKTDAAIVRIEPVKREVRGTKPKIIYDTNDVFYAYKADNGHTYYISSEINKPDPIGTKKDVFYIKSKPQLSTFQNEMTQEKVEFEYSLKLLTGFVFWFVAVDILAIAILISLGNWVRRSSKIYG